jgi:hypothetical protein
MALEAISRSRFFAFCARDPANRICSLCSACSAYIGYGREKCSGYRRSTITNLKEVYRGVIGARHRSPPLPGKSATSATKATRHLGGLDPWGTGANHRCQPAPTLFGHKKDL